MCGTLQSLSEDCRESKDMPRQRDKLPEDVGEPRRVRVLEQPRRSTLPQ